MNVRPPFGAWPCSTVVRRSPAVAPAAPGHARRSWDAPSYRYRRGTQWSGQSGALLSPLPRPRPGVAFRLPLVAWRRRPRDVAGGTTGEAGMYPDGCVEIAATSLSNSVMRQASGAAASLRRCSGRLRSWALCQRQFGVLLRAHRAALAKRGFRSGYRQGRSRRLGPHPIARPYRAASGCGWHTLCCRDGARAARLYRP